MKLIDITAIGAADLDIFLDVAAGADADAAEEILADITGGARLDSAIEDVETVRLINYK